MDRLFVCLWLAIAWPALDPQTTHKIDTLVRIVMAHEHVPAVSLAIAKSGQVLYARGYGYRDLTNARTANADTVYNIASVSKQFTATCVMLLQQERKLSVDDSLAKYFPKYPYAARITLRNLLNHTSGIPDYTDRPNLPHHATAVQFFKTVWGRPLDFRPGSRYEYSNTNFIVLGMIVEKVSGQSYSDFVAQRIFKPLGMSDSSTRVEPREVSNGATGYTFDGKRIRYQGATPDDIGYGDGTVNSSANDLVKWDAALDGGRVVDSESWREMTTPPRALFEPAFGGYGFGLGVDRFYGRRMIDHDGANPGFITLNATFPGDGLEIVMLGNSDNFDPSLLFKRVFELVEHPTAAQIADEKRAAPNENPKIRVLAQQWLARLQTGDIDRSQLTAEAARELTPVIAVDMAEKAHAIGKPTAFVYRGVQFRSRLLGYTYRVTFRNAIVSYDIILTENGKVAFMDLERDDPALTSSNP